MKKVLITGASQGLGRAIAEACIARDMDVFAMSRSKERLSTLTGATPLVGDLSDPKQVHEIAGQVAHLDALVNNVSDWFCGTLDEVSDETIERVFRAGVMGTMLMTKHLLPALRNSKAPQVINILSTAALPGSRASSILHAANKWGQAGFSQMLRQEQELRVTSLYPHAFEESAREGVLSFEDVAATVLFCLDRPSSVAIDSLVVRAAPC